MLSNSADLDGHLTGFSLKAAERKPIKRLLDDKYLVFDSIQIGDGRYAK
jgi:hypothetical protein